MTEKDLFPRQFNVYDKMGRHYAIVITPKWEPDTPRGPDHPQSWGTIPQWLADIKVNGVPVQHRDLRDVAAGTNALHITAIPSNDPERPQDGNVITPQMARQILIHFREVMDELRDVWNADKNANDVVDSLLDD